MVLCSNIKESGPRLRNTLDSDRERSVRTLTGPKITSINTRMIERKESGWYVRSFFLSSLVGKQQKRDCASRKNVLAKFSSERRDV